MAITLRATQAELDLNCSFCREEINNPPALTKCQHIFCRACLDQLQESKCPLCKTRFKPKHGVANKVSEAVAPIVLPAANAQILQLSKFKFEKDAKDPSILLKIRESKTVSEHDEEKCMLRISKRLKEILEEQGHALTSEKMSFLYNLLLDLAEADWDPTVEISCDNKEEFISNIGFCFSAFKEENLTPIHLPQEILERARTLFSICPRYYDLLPYSLNHENLTFEAIHDSVCKLQLDNEKQARFFCKLIQMDRVPLHLRIALSQDLIGLCNAENITADWTYLISCKSHPIELREALLVSYTAIITGVEYTPFMKLNVLEALSGWICGREDTLARHKMQCIEKLIDYHKALQEGDFLVQFGRYLFNKLDLASADKSVVVLWTYYIGLMRNGEAHIRNALPISEKASRISLGEIKFFYCMLDAIQDPSYPFEMKCKFIKRLISYYELPNFREYGTVANFIENVIKEPWLQKLAEDALPHKT